MLKRKPITLNTDSITRTWLTLISGLTGFTEREMDVLGVIIDKRESLVEGGMNQPYLSEILMSSSSRKEYCLSLGITEFNLTNLLGSIRKKRGLVTQDGREDVDSRLLPAEEMVIKFKVNPKDDRGTEVSEDNS
jgi:hypothetical protein